MSTDTKHPSAMTLDELYAVGREQYLGLGRSGMSTDGCDHCIRRWADDLVEHCGVAKVVGEALKRRLIG